MLSDRAKALRPVIQAAFDAGELDAICELIAKLEARIEELEKRLNMNSSNSSKPPSSDGLKRKTKSLRRKNTGRKPGGQPGHTGQTLHQSPFPNIAQLLPCERTADVCHDLFGHRPSAGSVVRAVARCAEKVAPAVERIAGVLREAKQLHADETGVRCAGHTEWIHVASNATHTLYSHSPKRGGEGFEAGGVLPNYCGNLITDFWGSSDTLEQCDHSRCNAHLLRELTSFSEDGHRWAAGLIAALLAMKQAADDARQRGRKHLTPATLKPLLADYDRWISKGLKAHPEVAKPAGKRGRAKQSKEHNLLARMNEKRDEVLRFAHNLNVPFDNNQAERDLRMIKVQQKVSGCFRSELGARMFCAIRSYLSTTRKHGLNLMDSIKSAFAGQPVDFAPE